MIILVFILVMFIQMWAILSLKEYTLLYAITYLNLNCTNQANHDAGMSRENWLINV